MIHYVNPANVVSPRDCISNLKVIFDGGVDSFSVAEMDWDGSKVLGIRWNVALREWDRQDKLSGLVICLGMPTSRAYPVWFILPDIFTTHISQIIKEEQIRIKEANANE